MKRTELERRTPLARGDKPSRGDLEKAGGNGINVPLSWLDGTALALPSQPKTALTRTSRKPIIRIPAAVRARVYARSSGICIVCLHRERIDPHGLTIAALNKLVRHGVIRAARQLHHCFPKSRWPHLAKVEDGLVGICPIDHANHEAASRRIPRAALPACVLELAEREGLMPYIERVYPLAAAQPNQEETDGR